VLVEKEHAGLRLRDFLKLSLCEFSNKRLKELIDQGRALVNHKVERFYSRRLTLGDEVLFFSELKKDELHVVHETCDYIVVDKPSGFVCTEKNFRQTLHQKLFLVHRLDKGTSGVMILAKTQAMQEELEELFYERAIKKEYLAITHPFECDQEICVDEPLLIKRVGNKKFVSVHPEGVSARTYVQTLTHSKTASLVRARPVSGRIHQIRVHLQSLGAYIHGDLQYQPFALKNQVVPEMMLHATKLTIPFKNHSCLEFFSPLNRSFTDQLSLHALKSPL
jgi:RluA family pseudouridine synthase